MTTLVVYSERTGQVRRIISDDVTDENLLGRFPPNQGEAALPAPDSLSVEDYQRWVTEQTGLVP